MDILITGVAGFIGAALARSLLSKNHHVVGVDNLNDYYDVGLKHSRLSTLADSNSFEFFQCDIADENNFAAIFKKRRFDCVVNLAAQAGVRYSIENPRAYARSNLSGFLNVLEVCREHEVPKLLYASSSSVYGISDRTPFRTEENTDHPISFYAATKKANEVMAHSYSHLYGLQTIGLRFFTVYGPWGRPDMALFKFTKAILSGAPIDVYNEGDLSRDFTYIDDIVKSIDGVISSSDRQAHAIYNVGNGNPVQLMQFIRAIEHATGRTALLNYMPMQAGDVPATWADTESLFKVTGYRPKTSVEEGVAKFVRWFREYYKV